MILQESTKITQEITKISQEHTERNFERERERASENLEITTIQKTDASLSTLFLLYSYRYTWAAIHPSQSGEAIPDFLVTQQPDLISSVDNQNAPYGELTLADRIS